MKKERTLCVVCEVCKLILSMVLTIIHAVFDDVRNLFFLAAIREYKFQDFTDGGSRVIRLAFVDDVDRALGARVLTGTADDGLLTGTRVADIGHEDLAAVGLRQDGPTIIEVVRS